VLNSLAAGGTHVSVSTLPEGHMCPYRLCRRDTCVRIDSAGGTHVSVSTLPEGHIYPKSIDLTTFSLANKIYHI
jgi:hypothetical protein